MKPVEPGEVRVFAQYDRDLTLEADVVVVGSGPTGAVVAKIAVLVIIIIFIQKRPQGLFALKGRFADN